MRWIRYYISDSVHCLSPNVAGLYLYVLDYCGRFNVSEVNIADFCKYYRYDERIVSCGLRVLANYGFLKMGEHKFYFEIGKYLDNYNKYLKPCLLRKKLKNMSPLKKL